MVQALRHELERLRREREAALPLAGTPLGLGSGLGSIMNNAYFRCKVPRTYHPTPTPCSQTLPLTSYPYLVGVRARARVRVSYPYPYP